MATPVALVGQRLEAIETLFARLQASGFDALAPTAVQTEQRETLLRMNDEIDAVLRLLRMSES